MGAEHGERAAPRIVEHRVGGPVPPPPGGTVAVLLHGRGSDEQDLQGLVRLLPRDWTLVTPRAPHAGAPWGYGPGWAWYRYLAEDRVDRATLEESLGALERFLDVLPDLLGGPVERLVLGGFSQGGTTSLAYALGPGRGRVAAVLNFSGFLADGVALPPPAEAPPILWGHGTGDPAIPYALALRGRARLRAAGIEVRESDHPIGHGIVPAEIEAAVALVEGLDRAGA